ncbi:MAG: hypothetical protein QM726_06715 [Chitinophagaceae bacterium]
MENSINYKNIDIYYSYLIDQYGFSLFQKREYQKFFGNFEVILIGEYFSLRYYIDRNYASVEIANLKMDKWLDLSFLEDLIYTPEAINARTGLEDSISRTNSLNDFIKRDFDKICKYYNDANYEDTIMKINEGLNKQFYIKHPNANRV